MIICLFLILFSTRLSDSISIDYSKKYLANRNVEFASREEESILFQDTISPIFYGFMVAIVADGYSDSFETKALCGASLIDSRHILTAGHCAKLIQESLDGGDQIEAWIAPFSLHNFDGQRIQIKSVERHMGFKPRPILHHDIAIATLEKPVLLGSGVQTICIGGGYYDSMDVTLIGFGNYDCYTLSSELRRATGKAINSTTCKTNGHRGELLDSQVCASLFNSEKQKADQAPGDSGGPLFFKLEGKDGQLAAGDPEFIQNIFYNGQVGIVSYNYFKNGKKDSEGNPIDPCPNMEIPGTYTRVASYQNFIKQNAPYARMCN